jgi:hypothetical protein
MLKKFDLTFLSADRPLSKSFSRSPDGTLQKSSYPSAYEFTSHAEAVADMREFAEVVKQHAALGHCLLKGNVARPLVKESRAGATDANATSWWICPDIDRLKSVTTLEEALRMIGLGGVDYVAQYSASYGIEKDRGLTAHAMIMLARPMSPAVLKQWLIWKNLTVPALRAELTLTKTNTAIAWALDITTCQNDKLIYIAPPALGAGVEAPDIERIAFVERGARCLDLDAELEQVPPPATLKKMVEELINELRRAKGLEARKFVYKTDKDTGLEVLAKCDPAVLSGIQRRPGFVYLNLNGGDSWGYWHATDQPEVIRNWKGEPDYLTRELLPEYWATITRARKEDQYAEKAKIAEQKKEILDPALVTREGPRVIVFRDFVSDSYWNGTWNPATEELVLAQSKGTLQLDHWLKQNGLPGDLEYVPVWDLVFDPFSEIRVDFERKRCNMWAPSQFMKQAPLVEAVTPEAFPTINRVIDHAVAQSGATRDAFLNWFACIFRYRCRTQIAWVLHGVEGTGKGVLINQILAPLLGRKMVVIKRMEELEESFNGYLETALLVVIDEAQISESRKSKMIMANVKNQITEPTISVRRMYSQAREVTNYTNWMFLSNMADPVTLSSGDRRFNVGRFQPDKIVLSTQDIATIADELPAFAAYLQQQRADLDEARRVIDNEDRQHLIDTSRTTAELVTDALIRGYIELFWDAMPTNKYDAFESVLDQAYVELIRAAVFEGKTRFTRDELMVIYRYLCGKESVPSTPTKFTQMLRHRNLRLKNLRIDGHSVRGLEVKWDVAPEWIEERRAELASVSPAAVNSALVRPAKIAAQL